MRAPALLGTALALLLVGLAAAALFITQPVLRRPKAPAAAAEPKRLHHDVSALAHLRPRNLADHDQLEAAARFVAERWREEGLSVAEQEYSAGGERVRNLSVRFGPEGGVRVVVGAHYDAAGRGPGADDNASGVAGLLELGRLLRRHPPAGPVELVAYTLEEPPFFGGPEMGSAVHARSLRLDSVRVRVMIALEMIGTFSDERGSQRYPSPLLRLLYPGRGTFVAVAGRPVEAAILRDVKRAMADATDLPVRSITAPARWGGHDLSDNRSFWGEGYRALMVTDTAFHRNRAYHTEEDTPERLDYQRMAKVVTGVFAAVQALAAP